MIAPVLEIGCIARTTLNELAYERLKRALLTGRIQPGARVTLRQLAAELGTSIMPVREAVARLATEQAVEVLPNRGIRVPELSPKAWSELWELRINLEGEAVGRAATEAQPADLVVIRAGWETVRSAAQAGLLRETLEANSEFQFSIFQAARSRVLIRFVETLRLQSAPHCTAALQYMLDERPPFLQRTLDNDYAMVEAIVKGDAALARSIKQRDIQELRDFVEAVTPREWHGDGAGSARMLAAKPAPKTSTLS